MSTSLLYHGFAVCGRGIRYVGRDFSGGIVIFRVDQDPTTLRCGHCDGRDVIRRGRTLRRFRGGAICSKPVFVEFEVQRLQCKGCGKVRQVKIPFADENKTYTKRFARYVLELCTRMTIQDVAHHLQVSWRLVKEIQKNYLRRKFSRPKLRRLRRIAIDEISVGRRHRYLTVVLDLETGAVVFVGKGKAASSLDLFWRRLNRTKAKIEAVAIDMSQAYIQAVRERLPKAVLVFDHFHVIKLFNEKLTQLRRDLYREITDLLKKNVLKGVRWLLLKNPENLDPEHNERKRLKEALRLNEPLACAYYMKEDLRMIWKQRDKVAARHSLDDWIGRAEVSGIGILRRFAQTLATHREGILAYYDYRISTGPLEGTNTKIKTLQRQAYGYRDLEFFVLKIYALHLSKYKLVG